MPKQLGIPFGERECPHCGAKMVEYRHALNTSLAVGLKRISQFNYPVNIKALGLTRNQWDNFQKLRYWSLVAKAQREDGRRIGGAWVITGAGRAFVDGNLNVPARVWTYRGERVRYEGRVITFESIYGPYKTRPEYAAEAVAHQS